MVSVFLRSLTVANWSTSALSASSNSSGTLYVARNRRSSLCNTSIVHGSVGMICELGAFAGKMKRRQSAEEPNITLSMVAKKLIDASAVGLVFQWTIGSFVV